MADDIDDLLDEVESKFTTEKSKDRKVTHSKSQRLAKKEAFHLFIRPSIRMSKPVIRLRRTSWSNVIKLLRRKPEDDEINQLIDDICGDTEPLEKCNTVTSSSTKTSGSLPSSSKCFPLFIGGTAIAKGYGSSFNKRSCDSLRCTSCDFKVVSFDDFDWDSSTDYLFLRNHAPDFDRLKSKLNKKKGYRAFCCQCSNVAVRDIQEVKGLQLKWVCGKH